MRIGDPPFCKKCSCIILPKGVTTIGPVCSCSWLDHLGNVKKKGGLGTVGSEKQIGGMSG